MIGLADEPTDEDDQRLRKRVGVVAGYIYALAALQLPSVMLVAAIVEVALGGLAGSSAADVFAFLGPVYATLALGPRRATAWFVLFLVLLVGLILIDPLLSSRIEPQPYPLRLIWYAANLGVPLGIAFAMLRYTIKTIGDSYMAVAGAPEPRADHAPAAMVLARRMLAALDEARARVDLPLELRVGLASGPVVGGVIGQRRILFDLWGDTVNIASRMESCGVPGRIQVGPSTRDLLRDSWSFEEREPVEVKRARPDDEIPTPETGGAGATAGAPQNASLSRWAGLR